MRSIACKPWHGVGLAVLFLASVTYLKADMYTGNSDWTNPFNTDNRTILLYHFNESSGSTTTADSSGNSHTGTMYNGSYGNWNANNSWVTGMTNFGNTIKTWYTSSSDYNRGGFSVSSSANFTFGTNDATFEWWMYSTLRPSGTNTQTIIQEGTGSSFRFALTSAGKLAFVCYTAGGWKNITSDTAVSLNEWTHVAWAIDRTSSQTTDCFYLFINGKLVESFKPGWKITDYTATLYLLGNDTGYATNFFYGSIDEFRWSNTIRYGIPIAKNGVAAVYIAKPDGTIPAAEENAANELSSYLSRVTGATFQVKSEAEVSAQDSVIYVGQTQYAGQNGINFTQLGEEEWVIKSVNNDIILTGGRYRGTLYAVYEFLEKQIGIRWYDLFTEVVPEISDLSIPTQNSQASPAFALRGIVDYISYNSNATTPLINYYNRFKVFNKFGGGSLLPAWGGSNSLGSPLPYHSLLSYIPPSEFFATHPEYFCVQNGVRSSTNICFTNPDVRQIVKTRLAAYIEQDRLTYQNAGLNPPVIYDISVPDTHPLQYCNCSTCTAIFNYEGGNSGLVLNFINDIAQSIETTYPEVSVRTFAYTVSLQPPLHIVPNDNVIMNFTDYYGETCRTLTHEHNSNTYQYLPTWDSITSNILTTWDYWITFTVGFDSPTSNVSTIAQDISTFYQNGIRGYFVECEKAHTTSFHSLKTWVGAKMFQDPTQDVEALIDDFMQGYYGPAAEVMEDYMDFMEDAVQSITERIERASSTGSGYTDYFRQYLTLDYIETCEQFLDEAENLVDPESIYALHVRRERIPVDISLISMWDRFERHLEPGTNMPFDKQTIKERYYDYRQEQLENREAYGFQSMHSFPDVMANLNLEYEALNAVNPPLPAQFQNIPSDMLIDICWPQMVPSHIDRIVYDDEAVSDKAYAGYCSVPISETGNQTIYIYDYIQGNTVCNKYIDLASTPRDNKYYWYEIGTCEIKPKMCFATGKGPFYLLLDPVIDPLRDKGEKYKVYVSMKTAFGTGITWPQLGRSLGHHTTALQIASSVLVDRIILVNSRYNEDNLAYWKFDEQTWSGTTDEVIDSSGNGHHATAMNGAATTTDAKMGRAAIFDGIDDYVKITYDFPDQATTVMGWFKPTGEQLGAIFDKSWAYFRVIFDNSNKRLNFYCQTTNGNSLLSSPSNSVQLNQWYHFAAVADAANSKMLIYINGELAAEKTVTGSFIFGGSVMTIGGNYWGNGYPFKGLIDEISICDNAMTSAAIQAAYLNTDIKAYWNFDSFCWDGNPDKVMDFGTQNEKHHGTAMNGATSSTDAKAGRSAIFDGVDDYIKMTYDFPDENVTVMGWVKATGEQTGTIFDKNSSCFQIQFDNSNKSLNFCCQTTNGSATLSSAANSIQLNTWYHVAAVADKTNSKMSLYINGTLAAERTITGTFTFGDGTMTIGANSWGSSYPFKGVIDEMRIFQKALTEDQINDNK